MARIGIVIYSLAGAGAERVSVNLAQQFVAFGHSVDFIIAQRGGELMSSVPPQSEIILPQRKKASGWRASIRNYISNGSPDLLLAMMEGAGVLSIQAAKGTGVPVYVVSHIHFSKHSRQAARWKERWFMPLAVRWYLNRAAGVIGVSQGVADDIQRAGGLSAERVHTIYNPIISKSLYAKASESVEHPWFSPGREWCTVVTAGRLTEQKDHATLLKAIASIRRQRDVRLLVLGQGELLNELRSLAVKLSINDIVEFVGFDSNPYRYMANADVFVLSSRWEGFGNVLVEALASGAKVVSTDCPSGPREILCNGTYGALVKVEDHEALASAICSVQEQVVDGRLLANHLEQYGSESIAVKYLEVLGLKALE